MAPVSVPTRMPGMESNVVLGKERPSHWITPGRLLTGVAVLAVVAVAVWFLVLPHFTLKRESVLPGPTGGLGPACGDPGVAYTAAHAFTGPAPHTVTVYEKSGHSYVNAGPALPESWPARTNPDVRLVLCVVKVGSDVATNNGTCHYGLGSAPSITPVSRPMGAGVYRATLRELRTHRKVAEVTLDGADTTCPSSIPFNDPSYSLDSTLSTRQLLQAFGRYIGTSSPR
jgi:hypothetical protein